jgi:hypothetical protein
MSAFSNYLEEKIVQFFLQKNTANVTSPGQCHLALFTNASPEAWTDATVFAEPDYTAYARKTVDWTNIASGQTKNNTAVGFDANDAPSPVTITGIGVYDALTSGNLLLWAPLTTAKELANGDTISFAENAIVFTIN